MCIILIRICHDHGGRLIKNCIVILICDNLGNRFQEGLLNTSCAKECMRMNFKAPKLWQFPLALLFPLVDIISLQIFTCSNYPSMPVVFVCQADEGAAFFSVTGELFS